MSQRPPCRFKKLIQEAEGYLELAVMFDDQQPLREDLKQRMAERANQVLDAIQGPPSGQAQVHYLRGQALSVAERYEEAIESLETSRARDSANVHTCLALGWCYKRVGQVGLAIEALQNGLVIQRDSPILHFNMACYFALLKQAKMAVIHLTTALELDESLRARLNDEADFDGIREDPEFQSIATVIV